MVLTYTDPTTNPRNGAPTAFSRSPRWVKGAILTDELMFIIGWEPEVICRSNRKEGWGRSGSRILCNVQYVTRVARPFNAAGVPFHVAHKVKNTSRVSRICRGRNLDKRTYPRAKFCYSHNGFILQGFPIASFRCHTQRPLLQGQVGGDYEGGGGGDHCQLLRLEQVDL